MSIYQNDSRQTLFSRSHDKIAIAQKRHPASAIDPPKNTHQ
ncbi:hypothetical protein [Tolypothrix sp. NIES-4075]|nr:hypothetical protein [Tolypothrix sp. NIES-4075]